MAQTAERKDPELWEKVKAEVTRGEKGGEADQWSARKAQLAVAEYKKRGGRYVGKKDADNSLAEWTDEDWGTKSGARSKDSGERYLPQKAREALSDAEYDRTTAKKRADTARGKQFSAQPKDVAAKSAKFRDRHGAAPTKTELMATARKLDIPGRSKMKRDELARAVERAAP